MKKIVLIFASLFTFNAFAVDVDSVNSAVKEILDKIVQEDDFVEGLSITLDGALTDIDKPKIGVSASASTKQASWSSETTSLSVDLIIDNRKAEQEGMVEVLADLDVTLETDVFSLNNYFVKTGVCEDLTFELNESGKACETMKEEILSAATFKEQVKAIAKGFNQFEEDIRAELAKLEEALSLEEDFEEILILEYGIEDLKIALEIFESVEFTDSGEGLDVVIEAEEFISEDLALVVEIRVRETEVAVDLSLSFLMSEEELGLYSSFPVEILQALESATEESKEQVSEVARSYIYFLKAIVTEEF